MGGTGRVPGSDIGAALSAHLFRLLRSFPDARRCWIAFSGGHDSSVLLDLAAGLRRRLAPSLCAIHIDHGLNPSSALWAARCATRCTELGVPLMQRRVEVSAVGARGPEDAARTARYGALAGLLGPGDLLLTAHHRDDQAETLLLALLRGAGVRGLAAMPEVSPLGAGHLVRPLLPFSRGDLRAYAERHGLDWIEDPSNRDLDLDRNWLRTRVLPLLAERWPAVDRTLSRSAGHCAEASVLIERLAAAEVERLLGRRPGTLSVAGLRALDPALSRAVLRHWIGTQGLPTPDSRHLARVLGEVLPARVDASPLVAWAGCEVRRYRDDLFALSPLPPDPGGEELVWSKGLLALPSGLGWLQLCDGARRGLAIESLVPGGLRVRFGVPGLCCRPAEGARHRRLKHLYQEAGVPPWLRPYVPLVFAGDRLLAVGDLWICAGNGSGDLQDLRLVWSDHPWSWLGLAGHTKA